MRESCELLSPVNRYCNLAIQYEVKDGENAGRKTMPYGGLWDKYIGDYVSYFDPDSGLWVGKEPKITKRYVSQQALESITDFESRIILSLGGRRSGKTYAEAQRAVMLAILFPAKKGLIVSPTYRQARNVWDHIYNIIPRDWLLPGRFGLKKSDFEMCFINGSRIVFRSADHPDTCRSDGCAWVGLDERQDICDDAFNNAFASASEGGDDYKIFETATIKAELRDHFDAIEKNPIGKCYRMISMGNPFIGHQLFKDAKGILDERAYEQEIMAQWPDLQGRIYYPFKEEHIVSYPIVGPRDATHQILVDKFGVPEIGRGAAQYLISLDPPHTAVIWKIYQNDIMHAIDEIIVGANREYGDIKTLAERCAARYLPAVVIQDPHESTWDSDIEKHFKSHGFRMRTMRKLPIEQRLTSVRALMEQDRLLVDPKCIYLIESFNKQVYDPNTGKPDKKQFYTKYPLNDQITMDHVSDAAGYGCYKMYPTRIMYAKLEEKVA